jgi:hypothetical protein
MSLRSQIKHRDNTGGGILFDIPVIYMDHPGVEIHPEPLFLL